MINEETTISFEDASVVAFANMIRTIAQSEIQGYMKSAGIEFYIDLIVDSVSDDSLSATLKDAVTKEIYDDVPNNTGFVLNEGDYVRMYYGNGHQYIGQTFADKRLPLYVKYVDTSIDNLKPILTNN